MKSREEAFIHRSVTASGRKGEQLIPSGEKCNNTTLMTFRVGEFPIQFFFGKPSKNRRDLQGIRGIAISAVVLFHFFPNLFPNGHIGVDQFFVLSGFLMSMVTEREKRFRIKEVVNFYYRRSKRIMPLYLLLVMSCMFISEHCLFGYLHPTNWDSVYSASIFMTNIRATDSIREYHEMLSRAADFFTHTWSISAEMQFYIIFPLLYLIYKSMHNVLATPFLVIVGKFRKILDLHLPMPPDLFNDEFAYQFMDIHGNTSAIPEVLTTIS
ncbi:unnamed protein product [Haemonchus placei]|uniref:Acyl_transf_3 domain-containing protein n=1 Tax=Haemonchus placei TaxID=6290 RepID=A0A0N4W532_HAEPC|nr:unnamed protein product [Haemonchus placei]